MRLSSGLALLWKPRRKPMGRLRTHPQEGQAVPALALEAEMTSPILRGASAGRTRAQGTEAEWKCGLMSTVRGPTPEQTKPRTAGAGPKGQSLGRRACAPLRNAFLH